MPKPKPKADAVSTALHTLERVKALNADAFLSFSIARDKYAQTSDAVERARGVYFEAMRQTRDRVASSK